jgi:superfamily II DNA or RNA helicase
MSFDSACLRRVSNWSFITKDHKFDKKTFNKEEVVKDIEIYSPKAMSLIENIKELDEKDMATHGKLFKHFIFSEVKQGGYGVKVLTAVLLAFGFNLAFDDKMKLLPDKELLKTKSKNLLLLSSTNIYNNPLTVKSKKSILEKYNQRPENNYGDLARIILLDGGFKEGIDLFDVKYVHIYEPQTSKADQKQAIGRATRLCGQKGLEFHPKQGWPLNVFLYDVVIPPILVEKYSAPTIFKMFLNNSGIDIRKIEFADELEKYSIIGAVDYELNKNVHRFKVEEEEINPAWLFETNSKGGAPKKKSESVLCSGKCSARPTKDVPISLPLFAVIAFANNIELPKLRKGSVRSYFCELIKTSPNFCKQSQIAWNDPILYIKKHENEIQNALKNKKHLYLPIRNRSPIQRLIYSAIKKTPVLKKIDPIITVPKTIQSQSQSNGTPKTIQSQSQSNGTPKTIQSQSNGTPKTIQSQSNATPKTIQSQSNGTPKTIQSQSNATETQLITTQPDPPVKLMNFLEMRGYIRDNFIQYTWPKVTMENLCIPKGGSEIVNFTKTQDFIRNFYTPESPYKGMLLWHTVGTGKTCAAIATATSSFEEAGYTILWVTRTTLKSDIYKNMFDQVCSLVLQEKIKEKGLVIPNDFSARIRLLSNSWRIKPMSYKQFSNLVSQKNQLYGDLVKINGSEDPLRKTLLIIDEAHKLYGGADLSSIERPDMKKLHKAIMNSYLISGKDSVKLLMMTATPITNDPMELIQLINLCKTSNEQMPSEYSAFAKEFMIDDAGKFTKKGWRKYLDNIAGYLSYLNREADARQFAQPIITNISSKLSTSNFDIEKIELIKNEYASKIDDSKVDVKDAVDNFNNFKKTITEQKKIEKAKCKGLKKQEKDDCIASAQDMITSLNDSLFSKKTEVELAKKSNKDVIKEINKLKKDSLSKISEDRSQQNIIETKCMKKEKQNKNTNPDDYFKVVPSSSKSNSESIIYSPK